MTLYISQQNDSSCELTAFVMIKGPRIDHPAVIRIIAPRHIVNKKGSTLEEECFPSITQGYCYIS